MKLISEIFNFIINLLFPPRCEFCSKLINWIPEVKYPICEECLTEVKFIGSEACKMCGKQMTNGICTSCQNPNQERYYTEVFSACEYEGKVREKLLDFKFNGKRQLHVLFSKLIIEKMKMTKRQNVDIIISVPMHVLKLKERGYNQSELMARDIAKYFSIPVSSNNLIKIRQTENQSTLNKHERSLNLRDAFILQNKNEIKGKKILLIDDIITTGTTVNECSKVIKQAGAAEIIVATAATGKAGVD